MRLSDESLDDFIQRWQDAYGETITRGEASLIGGRLITLYLRMLEHQQKLMELDDRDDDRDLVDFGDVPTRNQLS